MNGQYSTSASDGGQGGAIFGDLARWIYALAPLAETLAATGVEPTTTVALCSPSTRVQRRLQKNWSTRIPILTSLYTPQLEGRQVWAGPAAFTVRIA